MKLSTLFFIVFLIFGLAVFGFLKATPGVKNTQTPQPKIKISPKSFDFGKIKYGSVAKHSFKVKNLGNQVLKIKRVATSCACTTAKINQQELEPGQETDLKVSYDTGAMSGAHAKGKQERTVYIKSNDPLNPQSKVMIYANVK